MDRLVKGGQGRTDEEVEVLSEELCKVAVFVLIVLILAIAWMGLSS